MNKKLIIGFGALALCGMCAISLSGGKDEPNKSSSPTAEPVNAEGQEASTSAPTDVPEVTTEPTVAIESDGKTYAEWARSEVGVLMAPSTEIGRLLTEVGESPTVLLSDKWKIQLAASLAMYQLSAQRIREKSDVPPEAEGAHEEMMALAASLDTIASQLAQGVDDVDASKFLAVNEEIATIGPRLEKLNPMLTALEQ